MNKITLEKADPKNLTIVINPNDVRKDLHVFARYCRDYEIKRAHRDNSLPKVHLTRLAKMMSNPQLIQKVREDGNTRLDRLHRSPQPETRIHRLRHRGNIRRLFQRYGILSG